MSTTQNTSPAGTTIPEFTREWIASLRELADLIEANPETPVRTGVVLAAGVYDSEGETAGDKLTRVARRMGGRWEKRHADDTFELRREIGPHKLILFTARENVCERVVTGTETVTREMPDPELVAKVPTVTVKEEIERVEWICSPSLLAVTEDDR